MWEGECRGKGTREGECGKGDAGRAMWEKGCGKGNVGKEMREGTVMSSDVVYKKSFG